ncbi:purple acid phosphatase family protein [Paenibacillus senegalensis]|uniref:purple acid phosphatase family protein n=1 Tax=Paenibacillus senegalensis TaxID=1465766 RepID=UPI000288FB5C|nr:metallophosphoesterase family protein [Paenibacillus senegalensis]
MDFKNKSWLIFAAVAVLVGVTWLAAGQGRNESRESEENAVNHQQQPGETNAPDQETAKTGRPDGNAEHSPQAIVTTFRGDPRTSRAFTWHTETPYEDPVLQVVKGTDAANFQDPARLLEFQGEASKLTLHDGKIKGIYKAEATELEPGESYLYRVGDGNEARWSEAAAFRTEPNNMEGFTFINVADSQGVTEQDFELWRNTLEEAFRQFPEAQFLIHNGDLTENPEDDAAWNHLLNKARPWTASVPLMPVTGNHDQVDKQAAAFISHFHLPDNGAANLLPGTTYTFDYGPVHFVMLNSEGKFKEQAEWLKRDLEVNRKPWVIVAIHRPAYGGNQTKKVIKHWVPLFDEYGVDLVLQGHNHEYSRSYPLKNGDITSSDGSMASSDGTVYVTINTSGQKFNEKKESQFYHKVHLQNRKQMYAAITVTDDTLSYQAYAVDGELVDEFELERKDRQEP